MANDYKEILVGVSSEDYGNKYSDHLIRIYDLYISSAENISDRREKANSFFLGINSALVGLIGYLNFISQTKSPQAEIFIPISIAGISLCYLWYRIIRCYKDLNSAKFKIVHEIEKLLPVRPYDAEWEAVGRGNEPNKYLPFTHIEIVIPWVFMFLHAFVLFSSIPYRSIFNFINSFLK